MYAACIHGSHGGTKGIPTSLRGSASTGSSRRGGAPALLLGTARSGALGRVLVADATRLVRAARRLAGSARHRAESTRTRSTRRVGTADGCSRLPLFLSRLILCFLSLSLWSLSSSLVLPAPRRPGGIYPCLPLDSPIILTPSLVRLLLRKQSLSGVARRDPSDEI